MSSVYGSCYSCSLWKVLMNLGIAVAQHWGVFWEQALIQAVTCLCHTGNGCDSLSGQIYVVMWKALQRHQIYHPLLFMTGIICFHRNTVPTQLLHILFLTSRREMQILSRRDDCQDITRIPITSFRLIARLSCTQGKHSVNWYSPECKYTSQDRLAHSMTLGARAPSSPTIV